ncbi:MAG: leucyl aminopeptidase [Acidobacteria bacterium]|nr:leucyl aminopeptidase [Acidobacteriota bacterium]
MHFDDLSLPIEVVSTSASSLDVDTLVVPVFEGDAAAPMVGLGPVASRRVSEAIVSREFTAKPGTLFLTPVDDDAWRPRRIMLVGLGSRSSYTTDRSRRAATAAALAARDRKQRTLAILLSGGSGAVDEVQAVAEGLTLAAYHTGSYKTDPESKPLSLQGVIVMPEGTPHDSAEDVRAVARRGSVLGACSNLARALVNEPGNAVTPATFADAAVAVAQECGLGIEVLEEAQLAALSMGLMLGVARGSAERPRMVVMRYEPEHPRPGVLLGLVGKGVTFDAGGISLKSAEGMHKMKGDMSGGAAVVAAMKAIATLKPNVRVTGIVPLVENMPGGRALKPGDVLRSAEGKTVEVLDTDAEGRLILGDALWYARQLGATHLIDVATLTGAIGVALGRSTTGLFGSPDWWTGLVQRTAARAGDRTWLMPIFEDYREQLRSDIADITNVGGRPAGAITAAVFLKEFTGGLPWAHLDIGSTAWAEEAQPHQPKGPTGVTVRTLAELAFTAEEWAADLSGDAS